MTGPDGYPSLFADPGFLAEAASANAQAVFKELLGDAVDEAWAYSLDRLTRNAVSLAVRVRSDAREGMPDLGSIALDFARLWEALAHLDPNRRSGNALANAATLYEVAGYQANAATLARALRPSSRSRISHPIEETVALFLQRKFVELRLESEPVLKEGSVEDDLTREMVRVGVLRGLQAAASYFMSGRASTYEAALNLLDVSVQASAVLGDVGETNLLRGIRSVLPLMHQRSTWETLAGTVDHPRWRRYLRVLARGLGQPILHSRSVSELWPSQVAL